jgi:hypothetical protein
MVDVDVCIRCCHTTLRGDNLLRRIWTREGWSCMEAHEDRAKWVSIHDPAPPSCCPRKFEHAVSVSVNIDKRSRVC